MIPARRRRSLRELTRRRGRSLLTVATIAVAVSGIWLFSIPDTVERSLDARVRTDAMHTVRLAPTAAPLSADELAELRSVDDVEALDVRTLARGEVRSAGRIYGVILVGVADFDHQSVNIVSADAGALPQRDDQVLTDTDNQRTGRFDGAIGDGIEIRTADGGWEAFEISGRGGTLRYSSEVRDDAPVLYLPDTAVQRVTGYPAPDSIDVLATDPSPDAVAAMVAELRTVLAEQLPDVEYWDVLEVWTPGSWPGSEDFGNFVVVFYVIAAVALVAALILIATTMNTVVREQTREIGVMKALGATSRQIRGSFLLIALLLGALGTVIGIAVGLPVSSALMTFMSGEFGGAPVSWRMSPLAMALSLVVGLGCTIAVSLPALRRAGHTTVRDAIEDHGMMAAFGSRGLDHVVARIPLRSRPAQMGVRGVTRRVGRTVATCVPIGLAVATMLGFGAVLVTATDETLNSFDLEGGDIVIWDRAPGLDARAVELVESVPEVEMAHQMTYSNVELDGERWVWGLPAESTYEHDVVDGRWFTPAEADAAARVVVIGQALAAQVGAGVGDTLEVETRRGPIELEVVGIDGHLVNDGQGMFAPIDTVLEYEGRTSANIWVRTASPDAPTVDRAAEGIEQVLGGAGYEVELSERYLERRDREAENRLISTVVMAMGLPVVAIGMIGLVGAMASNALDRTREIGVLRSIGARRRDLRAMFRAEGLALATLGWLAGIPLGYLLARLILWVFERRFEAAFTFRFPLWMVVVAFLVTTATTLLVIRLPVRRVMRMSPGSALRYE